MDKVISPQTTNILNNDGSQINKMGSIQSNHDKDHNGVSNLPRTLDANMKHANLQKNRNR